MSLDTASQVLNALKSYGLKEEGPGEYRSNRPWSSGSDSMGLTLKIEDSEHGVFYDYVAGEGGSLYELAQKLDISPNGKHHVFDTKREYDDLADYSRSHGVDPEVFRTAGWVEERYPHNGSDQGRRGIRFPTKTGVRWRFLDGQKPTFKSPKGYQPCWYRLEHAVNIARRSRWPLVICNGEPSVVVAQHYDVPACAVTGGEAPKIKLDLLEELKAIWSGDIMIAPDCDDTGQRMAMGWNIQLQNAGYIVRVLDLNGGKGFDLADFCALNQEASLKRLNDLQELKSPIRNHGILNKPNGKPPIPDDLELADRWLAAHKDTVYGMGEFRRYDGGIWPVLPLPIVRLEITQVIDEARDEGVRATSRLLGSVTELARVRVEVSAEQWDANHDYLICRNGALHIPSRTLEPHNPDLYATSRLDFDYDPQAWSDVWDFVLNLCIPEAKDFLQEFAGYSLTTDTKHEIALWLYGLVGSGKSTVLEGLTAMLGARAGVLGLADIERSRFALAGIPGKTLLVSAEQPASYIEASHILNAIISGERILVDRKFKEQIEIIPRAKLAWAMNELPRVNSAGSGLFRRVKVIKFSQITEADRNPAIKEQVKLEGAAILNWALDGLERLRMRGKFEIPSYVVDATNHFKETNDIPALFVSERCLRDEDKRTQSQVLYDAYKKWCVDNGHKPQSSTSLAEDWQRLGFEKRLSRGRFFWQGIGLLDYQRSGDSGDT